MKKFFILIILILIIGIYLLYNYQERKKLEKFFSVTCDNSNSDLVTFYKKNFSVNNNQERLPYIVSIYPSEIQSNIDIKKETLKFLSILGSLNDCCRKDIKDNLYFTHFVAEFSIKFHNLASLSSFAIALIEFNTPISINNNKMLNISYSNNNLSIVSDNFNIRNNLSFSESLKITTRVLRKDNVISFFLIINIGSNVVYCNQINPNPLIDTVTTYSTTNPSINIFNNYFLTNLKYILTSGNNITMSSVSSYMPIFTKKLYYTYSDQISLSNYYELTNPSDSKSYRFVSRDDTPYKILTVGLVAYVSLDNRKQIITNANNFPDHTNYKTIDSNKKLLYQVGSYLTNNQTIAELKYDKYYTPRYNERPDKILLILPDDYFAHKPEIKVDSKIQQKIDNLDLKMIWKNIYANTYDSTNTSDRTLDTNPNSKNVRMYRLSHINNILTPASINKNINGNFVNISSSSFPNLTLTFLPMGDFIDSVYTQFNDNNLPVFINAYCLKSLENGQVSDAQGKPLTEPMLLYNDRGSGIPNWFVKAYSYFYPNHQSSSSIIGYPGNYLAFFNGGMFNPTNNDITYGNISAFNDYKPGGDVSNIYTMFNDIYKSQNYRKTIIDEIFLTNNLNQTNGKYINYYCTLQVDPDNSSNSLFMKDYNECFILNNTKSQEIYNNLLNRDTSSIQQDVLPSTTGNIAVNKDKFNKNQVEQTALNSKSSQSDTVVSGVNILDSSVSRFKDISKYSNTEERFSDNINKLKNLKELKNLKDLEKNNKSFSYEFFSDSSRLAQMGVSPELSEATPNPNSAFNVIINNNSAVNKNNILKNKVTSINDLEREFGKQTTDVFNMLMSLTRLPENKQVVISPK